MLDKQKTLEAAFWVKLRCWEKRLRLQFRAFIILFREIPLESPFYFCNLKYAVFYVISLSSGTTNKNYGAIDRLLSTTFNKGSPL